MNIDKIFELMKKERNERFSKSIQLSLGKLIEELEKISIKSEVTNVEKTIEFDFGYFVPTNLDSWRGSYDEIALGYSEKGEIKISELIIEFKSAIGETFEGYKGGDFLMDENTPIWVSNYGSSGHTGIIGVHDLGYKVIILTSYIEY